MSAQPGGCMLKLPKNGEQMYRSKSALLFVVLSIMLVGAAADFAWAKDKSDSGSSDGGSDSGKGDGGKKGSGSSNNGGSGSSSNFIDIATRAKTSRFVRIRRLQPDKEETSFYELQTQLDQAKSARQDAVHQFNYGLADPKADLRKLEQSIRKAELAISTAGAKLSRLLARK